jgi:1-deoxy-D-xylulose-5-phosphate reductoisomerase
VCAPAELTVQAPLEFHPVDPARFPAPLLARRAGEIGGGAPCVLNAANEAAVAAFLAGRCRFTDIVPLVAETLDAAPLPESPSLQDLVELDAWARRAVDHGAGAASTTVTA